MTPSPYLLPDGPVAIQFSGGRSSRYMLHHIVEAHGGTLPVDCHVLFQNTGREMPETLAFVERVGVQLGIEIVWLEYDPDDGFVRVGPGTNRPASTNGEPFEAIVRKRRLVPNWVARFCTAELKVRPAKAYMHQWLGHERWTSVIGFRADEKRRAVGTRKNAERERWTVAFPMIAAGVTKRHVHAWSALMDFDLALPSTKGKTPLGNCDGCMLKSMANRAHLARYFPERAAWWAKLEADVGGTFDRRVSWAELIRSVERQPDWVFETDAHKDLYCDNALGGCGV